MGYDRNRERTLFERGNCEADAVYGYGTFVHKISLQFRRKLKTHVGSVSRGAGGDQTPDSINMSQHEVSTKTVANFHRAFQIDRSSSLGAPEAGAFEGLQRELAGECLAVTVRNCETDTIDG